MVFDREGKTSHEGFPMSDRMDDGKENTTPLPIIATPGEGVPTPSIYTARDVARIIGVTPRCIYQYATTHKLGMRIGQKGLIFDNGELRIMANLHYTKSVDGKGKAMRNVSRRDPEQMLVLFGKQDELVRYVRAKFKQLRDDIYLLVNDLDCGLYNRVTKLEKRMDSRLNLMEEWVKELRSKGSSDGSVWGRGASILSGLAPLTLYTYTAMAA